MTIFDYINDILYKKKGDLLKKKELESEFQPYMIQRWLSMHSNNNAIILGKTTNKLYNGVENKEQWYKLFLAVLPKAKFKRFKYIKKVKKQSRNDPDNIDEAVEFIATSKQMSTREVRQYVEEYGLDISSIKRSLQDGTRAKNN
jgi:hypothetical protein